MPHISFKDLHLNPSILKAIAQEGYGNPTEIQKKAIPIILERKDVLACAQTGTGKTAAFALPVLQLLEEKNEAGSKNISALIISPTRELATQIAESFETYGKFTSLKSQVVFGGVPVEEQALNLQSGSDILIATPGRLLDLLEQGLVSLAQIEILILDEADQMLDLGFINDIRKIINTLPVNRQTLLFSATISEEVIELADSILKNPVRIEAQSSIGENIKQLAYFVEKKDKPSLLIHILKKKEIKRLLVFTKTRAGADELLKVLEKAKVKAAVIHSDKKQDARQRALNDFKESRIRVLVATDIAARGIDVEELKYVINYELPIHAETYVHRIGRTGRAGGEGTAMSFCEPEELKYFDAIKETIKQDIPFADHPYQLSVKNFTKPAIAGFQTPVKKVSSQKKPRR